MKTLSQRFLRFALALSLAAIPFQTTSVQAAGSVAADGQHGGIEFAQAAQPPRSVIKSDREFLENVETMQTPTATPTPRKKSTPTPRPRTSERGEQRRDEATSEIVQGSEPVTEDEALDFIENFLDASSEDTPERELLFYARVVDFFGQGRLRLNDIARDQRSYYARWPDRDFRLVEDPKIIRADRSGATVQYRVRFSLRNDRKSSRGEVGQMVRISRTAAGLKISAIREQPVN